MKTIARGLALPLLVAGLLAAFAPAGTDVWCPHVSAAGGWKTSLSLFNSGMQSAPYTLELCLYNGSPAGSPVTGSVPALSWVTVPHTVLNFEGSARVASARNLLVKAAYQFGNSPSVCEFYLTSRTGDCWVLPNTVRTWFDYTGLALVNASDGMDDIDSIQAIKYGQVVTTTTVAGLPSHANLAWLSDQLFFGLAYPDADTFVVETVGVEIPAPISITGNLAGDRHLFFSAVPGKASAAKTSGGGDVAYAPQAVLTDVWCPHVTSAGGWNTSLLVYNPGAGAASFAYDRYDEAGNKLFGNYTGTVSPRQWVGIPESHLDYEGSLHFTSSSYLIVKASYQYGETASVCEFYLTGDSAREWVLPNAVRSWFGYTGLSLVNPNPMSVQLQLIGYKGGGIVAVTGMLDLPPHGKYIRLTDGIWSGVNYTDLDTISVHSSYGIPAPVNITGNAAGDRHLFFSARPRLPNDAGDVVGPDDVVGHLRYVPAGSFSQGSPPLVEGCRGADEDAFNHTLTRSFAAMCGEVSKSAWMSLKADQPTLPNDPSANFPGTTVTSPVQNVTWNEAVLFANLLSVNNGFEPCYYADPLRLIPISASNYLTATVRCDFDATGYRLPTEAEWEYLCRAGTTGPFSCTETAYSATNCGQASTAGQYPALEGCAWFSANSGGGPHDSGGRAFNPWRFYDTHGNVAEWCWDYYGPYPTGAQIDFTGPASGTTRVIRGGNWGQDARSLRSANRDAVPAGARASTIGFRLVRTMP